MEDQNQKEVNEEEEYKMKIELIKQEPNKIKFLIKDIDISFVNALRRTIQELQILAIDTVEFTKNGSALYDEILAHRLGLLPLKMNKILIPIKECSCKGKGCMKCTAVLTLNATGPCTVYAKDLKSKGKSTFVLYPDMPLVILQKDQELELIAEARLGQGKDHAKYSPGLIYYKQKPIILVNNKSQKFDEFKDKYPKKIFREGKIVKEIITDDLVDQCDGVCDDIVKIDYTDNEFIFTIESWGQLSPRDIFIDITKKLNNNFKELVKKIEK